MSVTVALRAFLSPPLFPLPPALPLPPHRTSRNSFGIMKILHNFHHTLGGVPMAVPFKNLRTSGPESSFVFMRLQDAFRRTYAESVTYKMAQGMGASRHLPALLYTRLSPLQSHRCGPSHRKRNGITSLHKIPGGGVFAEGHSFSLLPACSNANSFPRKPVTISPVSRNHQLLRKRIADGAKF